MKTTFKIFFLTLSTVVSSACFDDGGNDSKDQSTSINKIMCLGASRVEGARPNFESYRYELWKDLQENNWTFDFIGSQSDNASYPSFNSAEFDIDHEGRGGWTSGQILGGLDGWLEESGSPDIVLFSSPGGNDLLQGLDYMQAVSNVYKIIDILQSDNPNITIVIEQPAPGSTVFMTPAYTTAFNQMQRDVLAISNEKTTTSSKVLAVDMFTGFNDTHLADAVHYNEAGAEFIASRYYSLLEDILEE